MIFTRTPSRPSTTSYDVAIVGGATSGSSIAWHLSAMDDFDGRVLVVERNATLRQSATAASNNCMRQQFATEINVRISQFAEHFVKHFRELLGDSVVPQLDIRNFGYLADSQEFADTLQHDQQLQASCGAGTQIVQSDEIAGDVSSARLTQSRCRADVGAASSPRRVLSQGLVMSTLSILRRTS